jgi:hypothetical protein
MEESILLNKDEMLSSHAVNLKIGEGRELSLQRISCFLVFLVKWMMLSIGQMTDRPQSLRANAQSALYRHHSPSRQWVAVTDALLGQLHR